MKKTIFIILLGVFGVAVLVSPVLAATSVSFTPASVSLRPGQSFTVAIAVNPQGVKNYTAKMELRYPADLMEVKSFTFANGWLALTQPGYDLTDNTNGVLIKTAGYPGGVSSPVNFGTVSLRAKKSGSGVVTLGTNSLALDAGNQNVLAGASARTAVTIKAAVAPTPAIPTGQPTKEAPVVSEEEVTTAPGPTTAQPPASRSLLAAVGNIISFGTGSVLVGIVVGVIIAVLVGGGIYGLIRRSRRANPNEPPQGPPQTT